MIQYPEPQPKIKEDFLRIGGLPTPGDDPARQDRSPPSRREEFGADFIEEWIEALDDACADDCSDHVDRWVQLWKQRTGRSCPAPNIARTEFALTLAADSDLSETQIRDVVDRVDPPDASSAGFAMADWLRAVVGRFLNAVRPWFPIWRAYTAWAVHWCVSHRYDDIAFLCRDALPLFALARRMVATGEFAHGAIHPSVRLLHASRKLVHSPNFQAHFARVFPSPHAVALVDTGCYGSLVPQLVNVVKSQTVGNEPAVFFLFSRNPFIFGYMNYLMAWENIGVRYTAEASRSLCDFVIYAGDVLEALPKAYRVNALLEDGAVAVSPQDLVTTVLAGVLLTELARSTSARAEPVCERDEAHQAAVRLWKRMNYRKDLDPLQCDGVLFSSAAPKSVPEFIDYPKLFGLRPQEEMFGTVPG